MKKKLLSLCLVLALGTTAVIGGTLAYFTDQDQVNNTFAIGNISIDLWEYSDCDGDGELDQQKFQEYLNYTDIMPGDALPKVPVIKNTGDYDAYVRVAVVMNNVGAINDAIDEVYEAKGYTAEQIQAVYDNVFDGWGVNYSKRTPESRRMWMDSRVDQNSPVLFNIDTYAQLADSRYQYYGMYDIQNKFQSATEQWRTDEQPDGFIYGDDEVSYYSCIGNDERIYVFYLKLTPDQEYTLFNGLNAPADFTAEQMEMFEDLKIGIYADAIQVANFDTEVDAFNALEAAHPLGWWN